MRIKIFTTTTCPFCKQEKEWLNSKGIKYESVFVDQDPTQAEEMVKESGQMGVPFTVIWKDDGTKEETLGFDKAKIANALGIAA